MTKILYMAVGMVAVTAVAGQPLALSAQGKTPTQAYMEYHAAVIKATTLDEVLSFVSAEYRTMLQSRPKADQPKWLQNLKDGEMKDVKITKETITGDKCTLEATGTSGRGNAMKGKITMVKQGGSWKFDAGAWSTSVGEV